MKITIEIAGTYKKQINKHQLAYICNYLYDFTEPERGAVNIIIDGKLFNLALDYGVLIPLFPDDKKHIDFDIDELIYAIKNRIKNEKEAAELADRYDSITENQLTGSASSITCTLCKAVDSCRNCIHNKHAVQAESFACTDQKTYNDIHNANKVSDLLKAYKARAKFIRSMLMVLIIFVSMTGCVSNEKYTDIYDLYGAANNMIDNPLRVAAQMLPKCHTTNRADSMNPRKDIEIIKEFATDPGYFANEAFAMVLMSGGAGLRRPKLRRAPKFKVKRAPVAPVRKTIKFKLYEGNGSWGLTHIKHRHTPVAYLLDGRIPTTDTHLFMASSGSYIRRLMSNINKSNIISKGISKLNSANFHITSVMRNPYGIKRTYHLIIDRSTGNVVTFYPEGRLTLDMLRKVNAPEYKMILKQMR